MAKQPIWTLSENRLLKEMFENGHSDFEIAERLGRSLMAVRSRRNVLGLINKPIWDNDRIKEEILNCMNQMLIDRMPTASEIRNIGREDLHNIICKTKKYSGWAKFLRLETTNCETRKGQESEERIKEIVEKMGFKVERMSTKFPYDLLVDDCVKIDVKCAKPNFCNHSRVHTFGINKPKPTCDLYVIAAIDENDQFEKILVIPSHRLKMKSLSIGKESKWDCYLEKWEHITSYSTFYRGVS